MMPHAPVGLAFFPRRIRYRIERLSCRTPKSLGWQITHWSTYSLAQAAFEEQIVAGIDPTTVGAILQEADLQPHRFRYWKTTVWDDQAIARALKILWYYARSEWLWQCGEVVLALDEKPNLQVLERAAPTQPMRPGQIERQEFDYIRHGTVNLLASLTLQTGRMGLACLPYNDGAHFRPAVRRFLQPFDWARRIHLVMDNGPSHTSGDTLAFFEELAPRVQVLFTPTNASWLNQAELLLDAFTLRYLKRGSWTGQEDMITHLHHSRAEYNQRFAHPFDWQWSCRDFRFWLNNTPGLICCRN